MNNGIDSSLVELAAGGRRWRRAIEEGEVGSAGLRTPGGTAVEGWTALMRRIADRPDDPLPYLVAADYADEHRCPALAFVLRNGEKAEPSVWGEMNLERFVPDIRQLAGLIGPAAGEPPEWEPELFDYSTFPVQSPLCWRYRFRCGLLTEVQVHPLDWIQHGPELVRDPLAAVARVHPHAMPEGGFGALRRRDRNRRYWLVNKTDANRQELMRIHRIGPSTSIPTAAFIPSWFVPYLPGRVRLVKYSGILHRTTYYPNAGAALDSLGTAMLEWAHDYRPGSTLSNP